MFQLEERERDLPQTRLATRIMIRFTKTNLFLSLGMNMRKRNQIPCAVCVLRIRVPMLSASELQARYSGGDVVGKEERALRLKYEGQEMARWGKHSLSNN